MKFTVAITSIAVALALSKTVEAAECSKAYYQCGGENWKGPTCCEEGSYCHTYPDNKFYSQCLPNSQKSNDSSNTTKKAETTTTKKAETTTTKKAETTTTKKAETTTTKKAEATTTSSSGSGYKVISSGASGDGTTTRYWDCCKASCSWPGKASVSAPVDTCGKNGISLLDSNTQSGCNGGEGYMCNNNQPWAVNDDLAYGFAAASIAGSNEAGWCCGCYELTFTSGAVSGKKMVVQVTNTGGDLGSNHFDLQLPGGGVGIFNGCQSQWGAPSDGWGQRYGGVSSASECSQLPSALQAGCKFRFNWFKNADNPTMKFKEVTCPAELVSRSGCKRN
ncbi:endo-beta-D-1,4-glucanase [Gilbertella persicaria]|uniref:endo-beta-D-1,4-glucanase n=1 Tax=Gilbertella persicaria TaxID=101096 RepID=UPI002220677D|nr:endo-beta-D-1,4-glucanase [Gilbertella persicaria]KAI8075435.1 endo-beta-D-1,4-glucanase [Gilbertella persicaria]